MRVRWFAIVAVEAFHAPIMLVPPNRWQRRLIWIVVNRDLEPIREPFGMKKADLP